MAILEADLRTFLLGGAPIAGKVGQRVYPQVLPQNVAYPAISYEPVSKPRLRDIEGPTGRALPRIRISCWAKTFVAAKELADDVRHRLDGYRGAMGGWTIGSTQLEAEIDLYDDTVDAYRTVVDYRLSYVES